jgi:hypothetical protein
MNKKTNASTQVQILMTIIVDIKNYHKMICPQHLDSLVPTQLYLTIQLTRKSKVNMVN